MRILIEHFKI